jgi:uncharacterized protein (TIGR02145 family)
MKKLIILLLLFSAMVFAQQKGSFTDSRDGKKYKTVKIGTQTWMAENLNYQFENSTCVDCKKYGMLYEGKNDSRKVCPQGWHLPSDEEWNVLYEFAGGRENASKKLRAKTGWNNVISRRGEVISKGNGTDDYGFAAMPGGYCGIACGIECGNSGDAGYWWSATNGERGDARFQIMISSADSVANSATLECVGYSVRCVQNEPEPVVEPVPVPVVVPVPVPVAEPEPVVPVVVEPEPVPVAEPVPVPVPVPAPVVALPKMSVAQALSASSLPRGCVADFTTLLEGGNFSMGKFMTELPLANGKVKLQMKSPFGKPKDGDKTSVGLTVGCIKSLPESPAEIQKLLKDIALSAGLSLAAKEAASAVEKSIPAFTDNARDKAKEQGDSDGSAFKTGISTSLIVSGAVAVIYGLVQNNSVSNAVSNWDGKAAVKAEENRNMGYGIGAALLASGLGVVIFF